MGGIVTDVHLPTVPIQREPAHLCDKLPVKPLLNPHLMQLSSNGFLCCNQFQEVVYAWSDHLTKDTSFKLCGSSTLHFVLNAFISMPSR